ncbi:hypothetical protein VNO77_13009 [Canavalia gladiata]|uniref:Uncharacterized protein n=1 Tax=Canavalia gladiata TaxID=3824 RepID=A0AAN9LXF7_CANGL
MTSELDVRPDLRVGPKYSSFNKRGTRGRWCKEPPSSSSNPILLRIRTFSITLPPIPKFQFLTLTLTPKLLMNSTTLNSTVLESGSIP